MGQKNNLMLENYCKIMVILLYLTLLKLRCFKGIELMKGILLIHTAGIAQLVERNLAKVDVAGSSPVSRSKIHESGF